MKKEIKKLKGKLKVEENINKRFELCTEIFIFEQIKKFNNSEIIDIKIKEVEGFKLVIANTSLPNTKMKRFHLIVLELGSVILNESNVCDFNYNHNFNDIKDHLTRMVNAKNKIINNI